MTKFIPRRTFPYPTSTPTWFAGHMSRSLRALPALLQDIDLVIEARDARLPLSGVNGVLEGVIRDAWGSVGSGAARSEGKIREKVVVYTKRDLAEDKYEEPLRKAFLQHTGQKVIFADTREDRDVRRILRYAVSVANRYDEDVGDMRILVVGMPNVGKSSLLNALRRVGVRKGKAFRTGAEPGITRKLTGTVKINETPPIYVYDTPGVMVTYLGKGEEGAEKGLKLALTAGIKASLFEPEIMADYLLYRLNLREEAGGAQSYLQSLPLPTTFTTPTNDIHDLIEALARRLGALQTGGIPDLDAGRRYLLRAFIEGKFGRWTLDDLEGAARFGLVEGGDAKIGDEEVSASSEEPGVPLEGPAVTSDPTSPASPNSDDSDLDRAVSNTVDRFLRHQREREARREEGLPENPTQEKKMKKEALAARRLANDSARSKAAQGDKSGMAMGTKPQGFMKGVRHRPKLRSK